MMKWSRSIQGDVGGQGLYKVKKESRSIQDDEGVKVYTRR